MLRIKHIRIKNFRPIVDLSIDVGKMNIFVGLNDAGKSNVLKALNLFFNGETEPGVKYDFKTDYSQYAPVRKKKAKEITVSIVFAIPERYSYHDDVIWTRVWREGGLYKDNSSEWNFTPYSKVSTLLKRVKYKYVPAIKSNDYFKLLLAELYMSIAKEANNALIEKASEYSYALDNFTQEIGMRVQKTVGIRSNLIMPSNQVDIFKELIFITNDKSGKSINLSYRGDGIKALHIPAILKFIAEQDNRLMTNTAVPITSIWGYEEPENGIEMRKCFELAKNLFEFSYEVQEFITTHSPAFYQLGKENDVKVYYIYKDEDDYSSQIGERLDLFELHDKVGIMPIIAPIIEKKQAELMNMKELLENAKFVDKETIFVEGITDKRYLEMAVKVYSQNLNKKLQEGKLQIVTREKNGCGTSLLVDWAVAWMHLNYNNKLVVLLDADKEGIEALKAINNKKTEIKKNYKLKAALLQPTEDVKMVNRKINNAISFTVEHLLSYECWEKIKENNWAEERKQNEIISMFENVMDRTKSLNCIIEEMIDNKKLKETIIAYVPRDEKKGQILNSVINEVKNGNYSVLQGFKNTISMLEKEFGCDVNAISGEKY